MKTKKIWKLLVIIFISLSIANSASAQEGRGKGRIQGIVKDETDLPIENAEIKVTGLTYKDTSFEATSDEKGKWDILGLGTGVWRVMVEAKGYNPAYQDINVKQLERNPEVNFTLKKIKQSEMPTIEDESSISLVEQAQQSFAEKKYEDAISLYDKFLEKNPKAYQVHFNIGNCYKEKGELDKATEEYHKVLEGAKEEKEDLSGNEIAAKALAAIGECYLKKEDYENAQKYFKNSIEIYPKDEALAYNVAEIYFSNNKIDEAIQYFELSKQIKPDWGKPYLKLGYAYLNKGDYEKAKESLKRFLEIEPESPEASTAKNIIEYLDKQKR